MDLLPYVMHKFFRRVQKSLKELMGCSALKCIKSLGAGGVKFSMKQSAAFPPIVSVRHKSKNKCPAHSERRFGRSVVRKIFKRAYSQFPDHGHTGPQNANVNTESFQAGWTVDTCQSTSKTGSLRGRLLSLHY